jgi:hypothetical protein
LLWITVLRYVWLGIARKEPYPALMVSQVSPTGKTHTGSAQHNLRSQVSMTNAVQLTRYGLYEVRLP